MGLAFYGFFTKQYEMAFFFILVCILTWLFRITSLLEDFESKFKQ